MADFINLRALKTNYLNIRFPFSPMLLSLSFRHSEVRVTHFVIPSPKYCAPLSSMLF